MAKVKVKMYNIDFPTIPFGQQNIPYKLGEYHDCWSDGQVISSHDNDCETLLSYLKQPTSQSKLITQM